MACETYRDIIDKFVENLASPEEKTDLEEHMKTCDECRSEVEDIGKILRAFNSFESMDLPDDFMPSLHERLLKVRAEYTDKERRAFVSDIIKNVMALLYNFYRFNSKVMAVGICAVLISFFLGRFSVMPNGYQAGTNATVEQQMAKTQFADATASTPQSPVVSEQNSLEKNSVEDNGVRSDTGGGSEKRLMVAESASRSDADVKQDAPQEIQREKHEAVKKDTAASAAGDTTGRSAELATSSRNGAAKDIASARSGIQYKALQESGPKAAATPSLSQKDGETSNITVLVNDFDKKVVFTISLAYQLGGDIQQSKITTQSGDDSRAAYIVMKVPSESMASALEQIKALGEIEKNYEEPQTESATEENETAIIQINIIEKKTAQPQSK